MSGIRRFDIDWQYQELLDYQNGEYVLYADHMYKKDQRIKELDVMK